MECEAVGDIPQILLHHLQDLVAGPQPPVLVGCTCSYPTLSQIQLYTVFKKKLQQKGLAVDPDGAAFIYFPDPE